MARYLVSNFAQLENAFGQASGNDHSVNKIIFGNEVDIALSSGLEYTGVGKLILEGNGSTVFADEEFEEYDSDDGDLEGKGVALITSRSAADVVIKNLTLDGIEGTAQHGFELDVPGDSEGTINVLLKGVEATGFWDHGIHIDDQAGETGQGGTTQGGKDDTSGANSDASLSVKVIDSLIEGNGVWGDNGSESDNDGLRVDEGGRGFAKVVIKNSEFIDNGADGFELDETGRGRAEVVVRDSKFNNNGPFDLDDTDDGLDVDEAGRGDLIVKVFNTEINGNYDEGLDLDEADAGDLRLVMKNSEANDNGNFDLPGATDLGGTGVKLSEEGNGDIITNFKDVVANGNDEYGFRLEQFDGGEVRAQFRDVVANDNDEKDGIRIESYETADKEEPEILDPIDVFFKNVVASGNGDEDLQLDGNPLVVAYRGQVDFGFTDFSQTAFFV